MPWPARLPWTGADGGGGGGGGGAIVADSAVAVDDAAAVLRLDHSPRKLMVESKDVHVSNMILHSTVFSCYRRKGFNCVVQ